MENELIQGKIAPVLLRFAFPFMLASFLQCVYGAVDLFVVGRYTGSAAVSAVSIGSQLMMLATFFAQGLSMGGTVLIGRRIGEEDLNGAAKAIGNLSLLLILFSLALTPIMLLSNHGLVSIMQTPVEAVADTRSYLFLCSAGLPFIIGFNAISGIYRGMGDSKTPVYFIVCSCGLNIVLDFILVAGFGYGATGAAVATVIAQGFSFLGGLFYISRKGLRVPVSKKDFKFQGEDIKVILKVGIPLAMQDFLIHISFLAIAAIINTLGLVASAAVGVAEKFMGFAFIPPQAFSSAVTTMVAQNVGAGEKKRAISSMKYGIFFSLICGVIVCAACQLIPEQLMGIFTVDKAVMAAGAQYIKAYSIDCILVSFIFSMNAYFNGNGQSLICFLHSVAATFIIRIPASFLMSHIGTNTLFMMGFAAPAASVFSIVVCVCYFGWMNKRRKTA